MVRLPEISRSGRRTFGTGVLLLALLVFVAVGVNRCHRSQTENSAVAPDLSLADSVMRYIHPALPERVGRDASFGRDARLFPFDPNRADSATLLSLGLRSWQVSNMLKYRRRGGRWRSADDFRRLYGLRTEDYERLRPFIRIAPEDVETGSRGGEKYPYGVPRGSRPAFPASDKLAEGEQIDINTSDTVQWKRIPGIGSYYAGKIVRYRERLGGFVSVAQIAEVEGLPPGVERWCTMGDAAEVRRIRINAADFRTLVRHPYLSYEQTRAIVNHIRHYGAVHSWRDLRLYKEFTDDDFRRLDPYISFK